MEHQRHQWLRRRQPIEPASANLGMTDHQRFRSDNDLHQWRMWGRIAVPMTILSFAALRHFDVPFDYTPLAALPALFTYMALMFTASRDRRAGKRFSQYDSDDLSW